MNATTSRGNVVRRIIGVVLLVIGISGVILSFAGIAVGTQVIDGLGMTVKNTLALATDSMTTTRDTLEQTKATVQVASDGLEDVQSAIVNTGETVGQADALISQALVIASQDLPDTLDAMNAAIPPAVETTQNFLTNVETAMVNTSATIDKNGPLVNQALVIASQDLPDTLDAVNAYIPATAEVAQSFLGNIEATIVDTSKTVDQADAALSQVVQIASQDVPDTLDAVNASIPPAAETAQTFLTDVATVMVDASKTVDMADAAMDQVIQIASHDVPDTLDVVSANIPPTAEVTQTFLDNVETTLGDFSTNVRQTEVALDMTSQVISEQIPDTLDQVNGTLPTVLDATEGNINTTLALLQQLNYLDRPYRVDIAESTDQVSTNLTYLSRQLRGMDEVFDTNLGVVDQGLNTLTQNVDAMGVQLDQFLVTVEYLDQVSGQLRGLETYSDNNLELVSQYILDLSGDMKDINQQIDEFVALTGQLDSVSGQLRSLDAYSDTNLDEVSADIMALSGDVAAMNAQIDEFVKLAGQVEQVSAQLRALEPYSEIDTATISQDILTLSQDMAAINQQIGQMATIVTQLEQLSSQLRALQPYADVDFEAIGQDIAALAEDVAAIQTQTDQFVVLIDQYIAIVDNLNTAMSQAQTGLDRQLAMAKAVIVIAMIWILLAQITPLYLGWELVSGRRDTPPPVAATPALEPAPAAPEA